MDSHSNSSPEMKWHRQELVKLIRAEWRLSSGIDSLNVKVAWAGVR